MTTTATAAIAEWRTIKHLAESEQQRVDELRTKAVDVLNDWSTQEAAKHGLAVGQRWALKEPVWLMPINKIRILGFTANITNIEVPESTKLELMIIACDELVSPREAKERGLETRIYFKTFFKLYQKVEGTG